jgi:hypothetical protein
MFIFLKMAPKCPSCKCSCSILKQMPLALILFVPPILSCFYYWISTEMKETAISSAKDACTTGDVQQCLDRAELEDPLSDMKTALNFTFKYMVSALSFLLAMQLNAALKNNQLGVAQFGKLCENLVRVATQLCAAQNVQLQELRNIQDILQMLPGLIKHTFRQDADIDQLFIEIIRRPDGSDNYKLLKEHNPTVYRLIEHVLQHDNQDRGLTLFQSTMLVLLKEITRLKSTEKTLSTKAWSASYEMYGTVNNMFKNETPEMLKWFMNISMATFIAIMPVQFIDIGLVWACIGTFMISYFFMGLWIASRRVGNPFVSKQGSVFPTVTAESRRTTRTVMAVFREASDYRSSVENGSSADSSADSQPIANKLDFLTRTSRF